MPPADNLSDIIRARRTIGAFTSQPIDPSIVNEALELACWAPNHRKTEPWRYYWIGPESQRRIVELNAELIAAKKGAAAAEVKRQQWTVIPGWLVVTCLRSEDPLLMEEDYAA
ncbi:MAG: nitroreductase, partial [Planctomycetales bacterium 12-60-4]